MLDLATEYKRITFPPDLDWINKLKGLSSRIKALRLDIPTGQVSKARCGGLKARRRELPIAHVPRSLFSDLPDLLACADYVVDDVESAVSVRDPVAPFIDPLIDELEEQGQNLQEQEEEEDEEDEEEQSATAAKTTSSAFSSKFISAASTPYVIYPTIGASPAEMSSVSSALSSTVGTQNMATMELSASATVFVAMIDDYKAEVWKNDPLVSVLLRY